MLYPDGSAISKCECMDCFMEWIAIHPVACPDLECPYCNGGNTFRFVPNEGPLCIDQLPANQFSC